MATRRDDRGRSEAPALERGLTVLELVAAAAAPVPFGRIRRELDVAPTTASRLLRVLGRRGYVEKDTASGRYRLGPALSRLRQEHRTDTRLSLAASTMLPRLMQTTGNTVAIFMLRGDRTEVLAKSMHEAAVPMQPVGNEGAVSLRNPWGWVFLFTAVPELTEGLLQQSDALAAWRSFLAEKEEELATAGGCYDAVESPIRRIAAPIRDADRAVVGCLEIGRAHV